MVAEQIVEVALLDQALRPERRDRVSDVDLITVDRHAQAFGPAGLIYQADDGRVGDFGAQLVIAGVVSVVSNS